MLRRSAISLLDRCTVSKSKTSEDRITLTPFGLVGHQLLGGADGATRSVSRSSRIPPNLARLLLTNGVANPITYAYNIGLAAKGLLPWRPCDHFGIGWAGTELSVNVVLLLHQQLRLGLGHEDAIEMYDNAVITPWLNAALDLQRGDYYIPVGLGVGKVWKTV